MKKISIICCFFFFVLSCLGQNWTQDQLNYANTGMNAAYLGNVEKDAIMYINLARLYPQQFINAEHLQSYTGPAEYGGYLKNSPYIPSLISDLSRRSQAQRLVLDLTIYNYSRCFAIEAGNNGLENHNRLNCPKGLYAECLALGMQTGKDIALGWLIDHNTPGLGHRTACLNATYSKIGICFYSHIKWRHCTVANFN